MTEAEFRDLLRKIDDFFLPRQMGSSGESWVASGSLLNDASLEDLKRALRREPFDIDVRGYRGDAFIRAGDHDQVVLRIPTIPRINLVLFFLTILTTLFAGAMMEGVNPLARPMELVKGIPFSFTLMLILGTHEFGHYYFARKHRVEATLPYFIPAPTFIGTFGAFIKIKSPIYHKDALLQIGAAGPIAGFLVAVPALIIGLSYSEVVDLTSSSVGIILGDSLLMKLLTSVIYPGLGENQDILLHPMAFAGWIGLLVTMLNLLPIGQLDGGHVAYAMLGRKHDLVAKVAFLALIPLSLFSINWLVWGVLILVLMRTTRHPPVYNVDEPLSRNNRIIGYVCLAIFVLCFIPAPFHT
jgi:membrane-associated protease RseP (regulator of RpoE activity)